MQYMEQHLFIVFYIFLYQYSEASKLQFFLYMYILLKLIHSFR